MFFKQITAEGTGCLSYIIGCTEACVACVVDPQRNIQKYIDISKENKLLITHIFETHIHSDHVSGNIELRSRTGADICLPDGAYVDFECRTIADGDIFELGTVTIRILKTSGHTPESVSLVVTDSARGEIPWLVLTGDCLHVGEVGRPDFAGEDMISEQSSDLYHSLHHVLGGLPDYVEIFPSHVCCSESEKMRTTKMSSTIGFEKTNNAQMHLSLDDFIGELTECLYDRPRSFNHIIEMNKRGPALLEQCNKGGKLKPDQVKELLNDGASILDIRHHLAFGGAHIPGSINVEYSDRMVKWIGMMIEPSAALLLVVPDESLFHSVYSLLFQIGYDNLFGYLDGGISSWMESGYGFGYLLSLCASDVKEKLMNESSCLIDLRTKEERSLGYIENSLHIPLPRLVSKGLEVSSDDDIILIGQEGGIGSIAGSYLKSIGYTNIRSMAGGMNAWINSGYPVVS